MIKRDLDDKKYIYLFIKKLARIKLVNLLSLNILSNFCNKIKLLGIFSLFFSLGI